MALVSKTRRKLIAGGLAGLAATLGGISPAIGAAAPATERTTQSDRVTAKRPNILFILIDDLGYGDLSLTGNKLVATPNIDALARDGIIFSQFYTAAPICSPSRAGFMTGRFPARDRFVTYIDDRERNRKFNQANWLDPNLPTIPGLLRQTGYATGHFGKWHLGGGRDIGDAPLPSDYGFDESYTQFEGLGPRVLPSDIPGNLGKRSAALGRGPVDWLPRADITARFVDKTLAFVERSRDRPWFAQLWLDDVHTPWVPSAKQLAAVKGKGRNEREDRFLAVLVAMDVEIGRLIAGLETAGELQDTLIIFTSDNGPTVGAETPGSAGPYRGKKASLYEGGIRQPLIIRWPGHVAAGARDADSVIQAVDLLPTLAGIVGAPKPSGIDGIDVGPALREKPIKARPDLYSHIARPGSESNLGPLYAMRSGPWKLMMNAGGGQAELYNVDADPQEKQDRKGDARTIFNRMSTKLNRWIAALPEPGPAVAR